MDGGAVASSSHCIKLASSLVALPFNPTARVSRSRSPGSVYPRQSPPIKPITSRPTLVKEISPRLLNHGDTGSGFMLTTESAQGTCPPALMLAEACNTCGRHGWRLAAGNMCSPGVWCRGSGSSRRGVRSWFLLPICAVIIQLLAATDVAAARHRFCYPIERLRKLWHFNLFATTSVAAWMQIA